MITFKTCPDHANSSDMKVRSEHSSALMKRRSGNTLDPQTTQSCHVFSSESSQALVDDLFLPLSCCGVCPLCVGALSLAGLRAQEKTGLQERQTVGSDSDPAGWESPHSVWCLWTQASPWVVSSLLHRWYQCKPAALKQFGGEKIKNLSHHNSLFFFFPNHELLPCLENMRKVRKSWSAEDRFMQM